MSTNSDLKKELSFNDFKAQVLEDYKIAVTTRSPRSINW